MQFPELFKVFSNRSASQPKPEKARTQSFRNRVFMRCRDAFQGADSWHEIHTKLTYLHGQPRLTNIKAEEDVGMRENLGVKSCLIAILRLGWPLFFFWGPLDAGIIECPSAAQAVPFFFGSGLLNLN